MTSGSESTTLTSVLVRGVSFVEMRGLRRPKSKSFGRRFSIRVRISSPRSIPLTPNYPLSAPGSKGTPVQNTILIRASGLQEAVFRSCSISYSEHRQKCHSLTNWPGRSSVAFREAMALSSSKPANPIIGVGVAISYSQAVADHQSPKPTAQFCWPQRWNFGFMPPTKRSCPRTWCS